MVSEERLKQLKRQLAKLLSVEALSEEEIASRVGINRTLTKRIVFSLREEGFHIVEQDNKLSLKLDKINFHDLSTKLRTRILGRRMIFLEEATSTMDVAKARYSMEGLVVLAEKQTVGRGRRGKNWYSPGGGLWFSVILRPRNPPKYTSLIGLFSSLATAEAIENLTDLKTSLKWPNDIYVNDRKVCGVITEAIYEIGEIASAIVGIGINNNIPKEKFPEELREEATSLMEESGYPVPPLTLLCRILERLEKYYNVFLRGRYREILELWKNKTDIIGSWAQIYFDDGYICGKIIDVDEIGRLVLESETGETMYFNTGTIDKIRMLG